VGGGEAIRSVGRIVWPGDSGLNNARPRSAGRQSGSYDPSVVKTPADALAYIELLYKSGRMEDLAKLLRKSQVFRVAWLILQQSSPDLSETAGKSKGCPDRGESRGPVCFPASNLPALILNPKPRSPMPETGKTESLSQTPVAGMAAEERDDSLASRFQAAQPLTLLLQAYQNQDGYWAREKQRGQMVSIRA